MSSVVHILEFVGESKASFAEAIENAIKVASQHHTAIKGVEVYNFTGDVVDGKIVDYKANVKLACICEQE